MLPSPRELDCFSPTCSSPSTREWEQFFGSPELAAWAGDDTLNNPNATVLMTAFMGGVDFVYARLAARGLTLSRPDILFTKNATSGLAGCSIDDEGKSFIVIEIDQFSQVLLEDPSSFREFKSAAPDEESAFRGTLIDCLGSVAVEEAHHSVLNQIRGVPASAIMGAADTFATVYRSQEHEFDALKWKLRYAQEMGMSEETIQVLREQLAAARIMRQLSISQAGYMDLDESGLPDLNAF